MHLNFVQYKIFTEQQNNLFIVSCLSVPSWTSVCGGDGLVGSNVLCCFAVVVVYST